MKHKVIQIKSVLTRTILLLAIPVLLLWGISALQAENAPAGSIQNSALPLRLNPLLQGPGIGQWVVMNTANQPTQRHENAYVQAGGLFYLMGGRGFPAIQIYNPATNTWTNGFTPPIRVHHFQAVAYDNLIYVIAAYTGVFPTETGLTNIFIYDPLTDIWYVGPPIPAARQRGGAGVVVYNDKFYVVGGVQLGHGAAATSLPFFDEFDPETNVWTVLPDMPRVRDHFNASIVGDRIYAAGGRDTGVANFFNAMIPQVDVYDFNTGVWITLPASSNIPTPRGGTTNAVLGNEILVIGGEGNGQAFFQTEAFDTTTNTWRALDNLNQERHGTQAATCNGAVYIVAGGGTQGGAVELTAPEMFYFGTTPPACPLVPITPGVASAPNTNFGVVSVNTSSTRSIVVSNTSGNQGLIMSDIDLVGTGEFTLGMLRPLPIVIPPGESVNVDVTFTPTTSGIRTANLEVTYGTTSQTAAFVITGDGSILSTSTIPPTLTNTPLPTISPTATLSAGSNPVSVAASGGDSAQLSVYAADPFVTKIADPPFALPGESVIFTFTVTNPNAVPLNNIQAIDPLPAEIEIISASASSGSATITGQSVIFTQAVLNPGETATITINTRVRDTVATPFTIINQVCARAEGLSDEHCARASVLSIDTLPQTGQTPATHLQAISIWVALFIGGLVTILRWMTKSRVAK